MKNPRCRFFFLKVSNFYNTMAEQIVDSQKGMIIMEAQKFETGVFSWIFARFFYLITPSFSLLLWLNFFNSSFYEIIL